MCKTFGHNWWVFTSPEGVGARHLPIDPGGVQLRRSDGGATVSAKVEVADVGGGIAFEGLGIDSSSHMAAEIT